MLALCPPKAKELDMETNNFLSRKFIFAKILMKINEH